MRYKLLGRSGLRVSELALGTMTFGSDWGWGADADESRRIFARYDEAGGNFVDTANNYTDGTSETLVGEFTQEERERWVIATKYSLTVDRKDPNAGGNHRKSLVRSLEQSLRRLRTEYVDLLWLHMRDATTPIEEAVRALDDQVRLGKVLYVGISDSPAWVAAQANTIADLRGWSPFVALQIPYSVSGRQPERELLPMAASLGLAVVPWGVLEAGILTGKPAAERRWPDERADEQTGKLVEKLVRIAERRGATPAQVAIAWLRGAPGPPTPGLPTPGLPTPGLPTIVPIVGARTDAQMIDNLGALALELTVDEWRELEEAGRPELGFPRSFLESESVRGLIYGEAWERLEVVVR